MNQAILIGGPATRASFAVGAELLEVLIVPVQGVGQRYLYVGDMELEQGRSLRVYRHESISAEEIETTVRLAHAGHSGGLSCASR